MDPVVPPSNINKTDAPLSDTTLNPSAMWAAADFWRDPLAYRQVAVGIQHVEGQRLLALFSFDPRSLVIDLGTGDGSLAFDHILPQIPDGLLIGVDKSEQMLEGAARYIQGKQGADRVCFLPGDVTDVHGAWLQRLLPIVRNEERPVVIFTNSMLHHIHDQEQFRLALRTIRGLLHEAPISQPTRFLASFAGEGNFDLLVSCCEEVRTQTAWTSFFSEWKGYPLLRPSADNMKLELFEAGFDLSDATVELASIDILLESEDQLFRFVKGCMRSFMNHLQLYIQAQGIAAHEEQTLCNQFAQQATDLYLARCNRMTSGEIVFPVSNIEISIAPEAAARGCSLNLH